MRKRKNKSYIGVALFAIVLFFLHLMWAFLVGAFMSTDKYPLGKAKLFVLIGTSTIVCYTLLYYYYMLARMKDRMDNISNTRLWGKNI